MRTDTAMQIQSVHVLNPKSCFGKTEARRRLSLGARISTLRSDSTSMELIQA